MLNLTPHEAPNLLQFGIVQQTPQIKCPDHTSYQIRTFTSSFRTTRSTSLWSKPRGSEGHRHYIQQNGIFWLRVDSEIWGYVTESHVRLSYSDLWDSLTYVERKWRSFQDPDWSLRLKNYRKDVWFKWHKDNFRHWKHNSRANKSTVKNFNVENLLIYEEYNLWSNRW